MSERDALAAHIFPREWALWATQTGKVASKKRQQLRKRAEDEVLLAHFRSLDRSCGNCGSYSKGICDAKSDFYGNVHTKPDSLCIKWSP